MKGRVNVKQAQWAAVIALVLIAGYLTSSWLQRLNTVDETLGAAAGLSKRFEKLSPQDGDLKQDELKKALEAGKVAIARIKDRHLFVPKPGQPFRSIRGILGDQVIFESGQAVAVGGNFSGAKVVALGSDWVELEFEEEKIILGVYGGKGTYDRDQQLKKEAEEANKRLEEEQRVQALKLLGIKVGDESVDNNGTQETEPDAVKPVAERAAEAPTNES